MIKIILLNIILAGSHVAIINANMKVSNYEDLSSRNYFETLSEFLQADFKVVIFSEIVNIFKENPNAAFSNSRTILADFARWNIQSRYLELNNSKSRFLFFHTGISPPESVYQRIF